VPPGATASGEKGAACRVKSAWADADDSNTRNAAIAHKIEIVGCAARMFNLYFDDLDMSRFK
jgi:hypothetical protein